MSKRFIVLIHPQCTQTNFELLDGLEELWKSDDKFELRRIAASELVDYKKFLSPGAPDEEFWPEDVVYLVEASGHKSLEQAKEPCLPRTQSPPEKARRVRGRR